ncbi:MAG: InlB B-repeat-containing protein [Clostridia bacterium]|jgi:uncharacterized repeat protein (TIGR02543 family)
MGGRKKSQVEQKIKGNVMLQIVDLIRQDKLFKLKNLIKKDKSILQYKYGAFPLLSIAILFNSKKLIKYFTEFYYTDFIDMPDDFNVRNEFREIVKGRLSVIYEHNKNIIQPYELMLIKGNFKGFIYFTEQNKQIILPENIEKIKELLRITKQEYALDISFNEEQNIVTFVCSKEQKKKYLLKLVKKISVIFGIILSSMAVLVGVFFALFTTINFNALGGLTAENKWHFRFSKLNDLPEPSKTGYLFNGWYLDESCLNAVNSESYYTSKITLYAGWEYFGYGTETEPYEISNVNRLNYLNGQSGCYLLTTDLNITGAWTPINSFSGTLNGNSNTILFSTSSLPCLFNILNENGIIENLTISANITFSNFAVGYVGTFATQNYGTIDNCVAINNVVLSESFADNLYYGGLVGINKAGGVISNSAGQGSISVQCDSVNDCTIGGIAGYNEGLIENVINDATLSGNADFGGIVGVNAGEIINAVNNGIININNEFSDTNWSVIAGGISTTNIEDAQITYSKNTVNITAISTSCSVLAGGIVGQIVTTTSSVSDCYNTGIISAQSTVVSSADNNVSFAGGIVAYSIGIINRTYNLGNIISQAYGTSAYAGGIVAYAGDTNNYSYWSATITNSYNKGTINASHTDNTFVISVAGGIAGKLIGTILNCYNTAEVNIGTTGDNVGGILGRCISGIYEVTNCHWLYLDLGDAQFGISAVVTGLIFSTDTGTTKYTALANMYTLSDTLGEEFVDVANDTPNLQ